MISANLQFTLTNPKKKIARQTKIWRLASIETDTAKFRITEYFRRIRLFGIYLNLMGFLRIPPAWEGHQPKTKARKFQAMGTASKAKPTVAQARQSSRPCIGSVTTSGIERKPGLFCFSMCGSLITIICSTVLRTNCMPVNFFTSPAYKLPALSGRQVELRSVGVQNWSGFD